MFRLDEVEDTRLCRQNKFFGQRHRQRDYARTWNEYIASHSTEEPRAILAKTLHTVLIRKKRLKHEPLSFSYPFFLPPFFPAPIPYGQNQILVPVMSRSAKMLADMCEL